MPTSTERSPSLVSVELDLPFISSRFDEDTWFVKIPIKSANKIDWSAIIFRDGSRLTDRKHRRLLLSCKTYLVLLAAARASTKRTTIRGGSVLNAFNYLREFVAWMYDRHNVRLFSQLSLAHLVTFRNYVRRMQARKNGKGGVAVPSGKRAAPASREMRLMYLRYIVRLQDDIPDGTRLNYHDVYEALHPSPGKPEAKTKRIPDDIFITLMAEAQRWVFEVAPSIVTVVHEMRAYRAETIEDWRRRGREVRAFSYQEFYKLPHDPTIVTICGEPLNLWAIPAKKFDRLIAATHGACYAVIAGFVGMRVSEVLALRPGCIRAAKTTDGRELLKIAGTLFKTARSANGEPAEWVAGWNQPTNAIHKAVDILTQLGRHDSFLFAHLWKLNTDDKRVGPSKVSRDLAIFSDYAGITGRWQLSSHQFRKTFARFVALASPAAAGALQRHFKHVSIQMTERYFPDDPELLQDIAEAALELVEERYDKILGAERLAGIRGAEIIASNAAYRGSAAADKRREIVRQAAVDPTIRLVMHPYGSCLYDAPRAKCQGYIEKVGLDACIQCSNLVVDESHLPFWQEHADGLRETIAWLQTQNVVNLELMRQLAAAEDILQQLTTEASKNRA